MATTRENTDGGWKEHPRTRESVVRWLLNADPAIRWQVMRDLLDESPAVIALERARIANEGWGSLLLDNQRADGTWGDGSAAPQWQSTLCTLVLLRELGLEPTSERARSAVELVRDRVTWGPWHGNSPFFEGESEPCINGRVLGLASYFGLPCDRLVDRLLREQLADGGWNCETKGEGGGVTRSSFNSTICVLEGLLQHQKSNGIAPTVTDARVRAEEYILERRLFRRLSTGEVINDRKGNHDWTHFAFPTTWHYDVLRGLDYLRDAGTQPDQRVAEAVSLVASRQNEEGQWTLHSHHNPVDLDMEGAAGSPSRWNTLRALRVLDWHAGNCNLGVNARERALRGQSRRSSASQPRP